MLFVSLTLRRVTDAPVTSERHFPEGTWERTDFLGPVSGFGYCSYPPDVSRASPEQRGSVRRQWRRPARRRSGCRHCCTVWVQTCPVWPGCPLPLHVPPHAQVRENPAFSTCVVTVTLLLICLFVYLFIGGICLSTYSYLNP